MNTTWIIEIGVENPHYNRYDHLGYVNKIFETRVLACNYVMDKLLPSKEGGSTGKFECFLRDNRSFTMRANLMQTMHINPEKYNWTSPYNTLSTIEESSEDPDRTYVLEVQAFPHDKNVCSGFCHVGYVDWLFESRQLAGEFYHRMYPDYRDINRDGNWTSDWAAVDGLRCVVREYANECTDIRWCRPLVAGQERRVERMNKAIRRENDLADNWSRVTVYVK